MSEHDGASKMWYDAFEAVSKDLEKSRQETFDLKLFIARNCESTFCSSDDYKILQECWELATQHEQSLKYSVDIDYSIGTVFGIDEWKDNVRSGGFIDYDGYGKAIKDGKMTTYCFSPSEINIIPSDATHILWYNR